MLSSVLETVWAICEPVWPGRRQLGDRRVERAEDALRRRRRRDLELVARRRRAADGERHAVDRDRLTRDVGRRGHCRRRAVLQHRIGRDAAAHGKAQRVVGAGQGARVGDRAGIDRRVGDARVGAGREHAVAGRCRHPHGIAVGRQRQVGAAAGERLTRRSGVLDATRGFDEGLLRRRLAAEDIAAGTVAGVGDIEQLAADRLQLGGDRLAIGIAQGRVAGLNDQSARALQQVAGVAERALGLRHDGLARRDGALRCRDLALRRDGALRDGSGRRVVARLVDALAGRHLVLQVRHVELALHQGGDAGVVGVGGADAHGGRVRDERRWFSCCRSTAGWSNTVWAICSILAAAW